MEQTDKKTKNNWWAFLKEAIQKNSDLELVADETGEKISVECCDLKVVIIDYSA